MELKPSPELQELLDFVASFYGQWHPYMTTQELAAWECQREEHVVEVEKEMLEMIKAECAM